MIEQGKIVTIQDETVTLSCSALSGGCKSCKANSFCSVNGHTFDAINRGKLNLKSGDLVEIYLPTGRTLFSGFMVLIFPLILFIIFFLTGSVLLKLGDGPSTAFGIGGLAAGFAITAVYNKVSRIKNTPRITKRLEEKQEEENGSISPEPSL